MFRVQNRSRKYTFLVAFFTSFFLLFSGLAMGVEGAHERGHGRSHESLHEVGGHDSGHGGDRYGDLRDLLYRFINFTLLVIILFIAIKKGGLKDSLMDRIEEIGQRLDGLKKEREESEGRYRDMEKKLRDFEKIRKDIIKEFQKEGLAEKEKIIVGAKERAKQIIEQAELTIQQEMQSAKERLKQEVMDLAARRAQEIIAKEITDKDQHKLVNEFIERVGKIH